MALLNGHEHHPTRVYIGMDAFDSLVGLLVTIFGIKIARRGWCWWWGCTGWYDHTTIQMIITHTTRWCWCVNSLPSTTITVCPLEAVGGELLMNITHLIGLLVWSGVIFVYENIDCNTWYEWNAQTIKCRIAWGIDKGGFRCLLSAIVVVWIIVYQTKQRG